ncbi:uncharacterized protein LOC131148680 [Malania oleifera]|uniref:uncharacterized protein LOC131148680 n=1 Tax=Malania oleifera TaxID=397392 RepID=UPI0025AE73E6|nr:uncharacterized protein LOC131148680 [Malania oleifera]XP_057954538.1 uncharacterized protein LOC131148680 [Malania oleifera]XP_057954539.1 uncharacterized protein LOC131148680 [Malania oleifera]XP_057954540.1 uncharacterized protein LOC131148680 [Malania oleifera]
MPVRVKCEAKIKRGGEMQEMQLVLPLLGIVAAAAVTFYAVSFAELREKSFRDLEESESENGGFKPSMSSREKRARRQANKKAKG